MKTNILKKNFEFQLRLAEKPRNIHSLRRCSTLAASISHFFFPHFYCVILVECYKKKNTAQTVNTINFQTA